MKTNAGIRRILGATLGPVLVAPAAATTIAPWGWLGIVQLAPAAFSFCLPLAAAGHQHLPDEYDRSDGR